MSEFSSAVDFFAAQTSGDIETKITVHSDLVAQVEITNKTPRPLVIKLPEAFAAVPVLAQQPPRNQGRGARNPNVNAQQPQAAGGGMQQFGQQGAGQQGRGLAFFNLPPEKAARFKVPCVCLDHGKKTPLPSIAYQICPIGEYSTQAGVAQLCAALGRDEVDQHAAQAAAWRLNNDLSWEQLAQAVVKHGGRTTPQFSEEELARAKKAAQTALSQWRLASASAEIHSAGQQPTKEGTTPGR